MTAGRRAARVVYAGLDLGTSGCKGVLVTADGRVVARAAARYPTHRPEPGAAEQQPGDWLKAFTSVTLGLAQAVAAERWQAVGLSAMLPTLVLTDGVGAAATPGGIDAPSSRRHLEPLGPAITWEDGRAEAEGSAFREGFGGDALYRRTGQWVDGRYLVPMALRLAAREPERVRAARYLLGAKDYLFGVLTGRGADRPVDRDRRRLLRPGGRRLDSRGRPVGAAEAAGDRPVDHRASAAACRRPRARAGGRDPGRPRRRGLRARRARPRPDRTGPGRLHRRDQHRDTRAGRHPGARRRPPLPGHADGEPGQLGAGDGPAGDRKRARVAGRAAGRRRPGGAGQARRRGGPGHGAALPAVPAPRRAGRPLGPRTWPGRCPACTWGTARATSPAACATASWRRAGTAWRCSRPRPAEARS